MPKLAILMICHNRLGFTQLSLSHLLEGLTSELADVFVVDNASTDETPEYLSQLRHPRLKAVLRMEMNYPLSEVTNLFWYEVARDYEYVGKVDNDTIVPQGYFLHAMETMDCCRQIGMNLAALSAIHFSIHAMSRIDPAVYVQNIERLPNGYGLLIQPHVGGCCYVLDRTLARQFGPLKTHEGQIKLGWTECQWDMAERGIPAAYLLPFQFAKHLDDRYYGLTHELTGELGSEHLRTLGAEEQLKQEIEQATHLLGQKPVQYAAERVRPR